jgi:hypothetical protein
VCRVRVAGFLWLRLKSPRHGLGWRLLALLHGYERMARQVPHVEPLAAQAGFGEIRTGEVPPWIRYFRLSRTVPSPARSRS